MRYNQTMKIISDVLSLDELKSMAAATFGNLIKAVIDVDKELIFKAIEAALAMATKKKAGQDILGQPILRQYRVSAQRDNHHDKKCS